MKLTTSNLIPNHLSPNYTTEGKTKQENNLETDPIPRGDTCVRDGLLLKKLCNLNSSMTNTTEVGREFIRRRTMWRKT